MTLEDELSDVFRLGVRVTHVDIVAHDFNVVKNLGELRHIGQRLTVGTSPRIDPNGGSDVEILSRRLGAQFLEESKEVLRIGARELVAANARRIWSFPAVM